MSSDATMYTPAFINVGSAIEKLIGGVIYRHTESMETAKAYFCFFNVKSRLTSESF